MGSELGLKPTEPPRSSEQINDLVYGSLNRQSSSLPHNELLYGERPTPQQSSIATQESSHLPSEDRPTLNSRQSSNDPQEFSQLPYEDRPSLDRPSLERPSLENATPIRFNANENKGFMGSVKSWFGNGGKRSKRSRRKQRR